MMPDAIDGIDHEIPAQEANDHKSNTHMGAGFHIYNAADCSPLASLRSNSIDGMLNEFANLLKRANSDSGQLLK